MYPCLTVICEARIRSFDNFFAKVAVKAACRRRRAISAHALRMLPTGLLLATKHVQPPSFLVILADDLGYDIGAFGHPYAVTPHLDQLARAGMRLTRHYSYRTGHFGKWHLKDPPRAGSYGMEFVSVNGEELDPTQMKQTHCHAAADDAPKRWQAAVLCESSSKVPKDAIVVGAAIDWMARSTREHGQAEDKQPRFYANVWLHTPHGPNRLGDALGLPEPEDAAAVGEALSRTPFSQLSQRGGVDWTRFSPAVRAKLDRASRGYNMPAKLLAARKQNTSLWYHAALLLWPSRRA